MYITDFICTYKKMDSDSDKEILYTAQLLQAFGLERWDDKVVETIMNELYTRLKEDEQFRLILNTAKNSPKLGMMISLMFQEEALAERLDSVIFTLLFNYDFFDLMHKCICEHMNNGFMKRYTYEDIMEQL